MKAASSVNKWIISLTTVCACLMICMIAAAQMDPVYAGSHSSRQDNDFGSITVGNSTRYYDSVPDLLDDLEEHEECSVRVEMFKNWYMGKTVI